MNNQHRPNPEQDSQQQVDQTIELLESANHPERQQSLDAEQQAIVELSAASRESVVAQLPEPNQALRQQLIEAMESKATANIQPALAPQPSVSTFSGRRWATAALLLIGIGFSGWYLSDFTGSESVTPRIANQYGEAWNSSFQNASEETEARWEHLNERWAGSIDLHGRFSLEPVDSSKSIADITFGSSGGPSPEGNRKQALKDKPPAPSQQLFSAPEVEKVFNDGMQQIGGGAGQQGAGGEDGYADSVEFLLGGGGGGFDGRGPDNLRSGRRSRERYVRIYENAFTGVTGSDAVSTFSIDVDTASYANTRRFLNSGQLPPPDAVRIEELINYFPYKYDQPTGEDPFSVNMELAACPWQPKHKLVRVGIKGKEIPVTERKPTHLVFLLDVSGSMNSTDKLPLLKRGFKMMVNQLNENDQVTIVTYAGQAGLALETTTGDQKSKINQAIDVLAPGGSTHGSAGIELAYQLAQQNFIQDGNNKVILATDGDLNVGITDNKPLVELIKQKASEGVFLTVLGFGTGNLQDGKMEQLADNGNGMYCYIDSVREARKVLVEQMTGSLVTIAKDVKMQIEFNPSEVHSYRLIGYENRLLATADFDNDRKDAGEIGAGHTVTAIYEIVTTDQVDVASASASDLKYQSNGVSKETKSSISADTNLTEAAKSGELLTLAMRYKQPNANTSKRIEFTIENKPKPFNDASEDFRFTASVAAYGMLLRRSEHAGNATAEMIEEIAADSMGDDSQGYRAEFIDLVRKAKTLLKTSRQ